MTAPRHFLNQKQSFQLAQVIQAEYANKRLNDLEFAAWATTHLGFEVKYTNIRSLRAAFEIPSTVDVLAAERKAARQAVGARLEPSISGTLYARVKALEEHVARLEEKLKDLLQ